jgi:hypothetical protein
MNEDLRGRRFADVTEVVQRESLAAFGSISVEDFNVSCSGSGAGIVASSPLGVTLQETEVSNFYDYFNFFSNNYGNFGVFPIVLRGVAPIF